MNNHQILLEHENNFLYSNITALETRLTNLDL